ncbi:MAG: hypothetical protein ACI915_000128 [Gammaproteobacteria bacterium]|jgi:hypothetical protein
MKIKSIIPFTTAVFCLSLQLNVANAVPALPFYSAHTFISGAAIDNRYFPMTSTGTNVYAGEYVEDGEIFAERFELSNTGAGKTLLGVQTCTQLDRGFEGDLLVFRN